MEVKRLSYSINEAKTLGSAAVQTLEQAIGIISGIAWSNLRPGGHQGIDIRDFKGKQKGAHEVVVGSYRTVFSKPIHEVVVVMGFFKKEGDKLKKTELRKIESRLKIINKYYGIK